MRALIYTNILTHTHIYTHNLRQGMEVAASRLETRRYAAMIGCTTGLFRSVCRRVCVCVCVCVGEGFVWVILI